MASTVKLLTVVHWGAKTALAVNVMMDDGPIEITPSAGNVKGVQCLLEVLVFVGSWFHRALASRLIVRRGRPASSQRFGLSAQNWIYGSAISCERKEASWTNGQMWKGCQMAIEKKGVLKYMRYI